MRTSSGAAFRGHLDQPPRTTFDLRAAIRIEAPRFRQPNLVLWLREPVTVPVRSWLQLRVRFGGPIVAVVPWLVRRGPVIRTGHADAVLLTVRADAATLKTEFESWDVSFPAHAYPV